VRDQTVTTLPAFAPAAQPLLLPYSTSRAIAREAEMHRDLLPLNGAERRASLNLVTGPIGDRPTGHVWGIWFSCDLDREGEFDSYHDIGLDDVEDFVARFGGPATHARAAAILHDSNDNEVHAAIDDAIYGWVPEPDFDHDYDGPEWNDSDDRGCL
jgi:hypothetical protein